MADARFLALPYGLDGIGPLNAIYQARFMRYLENRGISSRPRAKCGPSSATVKPMSRSLGSQFTLAAREKLDNLIFVVNCNLQRLDGPVRGNGKIIDELEAAFRGAGWNVIKVIWGSDWDELLARDQYRHAVEAHGRMRRRRIPELQGERRRICAQGILWQISGDCWRW